MEKNEWLGHSCEKLLGHQQQHLQVLVEAECRFLSPSIYLASSDKWIPWKLAPGNPRAGWSEARTPKGSSSWGQLEGGQRGRGTGRGAGDEGEGPFPLSALQLGSVSSVGFCPDASEEVAGGYTNIPLLDAMWCINKQAQRAWQNCLSYLIQAILCPTQEFFSFLYIFKYANPQLMQAFPLGSLSQVPCFPDRRFYTDCNDSPMAGCSQWKKKKGGLNYTVGQFRFLLKLICSLAHSSPNISTNIFQGPLSKEHFLFHQHSVQSGNNPSGKAQRQKFRLFLHIEYKAHPSP